MDGSVRDVVGRTVTVLGVALLTAPVTAFVMAYGLVAPFPLVVGLSVALSGVVAAVAATWLAELWTRGRGEPTRVVLAVAPVALLLVVYLLLANRAVSSFGRAQISLLTLMIPVPLVLAIWATWQAWRHRSPDRSLPRNLAVTAGWMAAAVAGCLGVYVTAEWAGWLGTA